ncbi:MAG: hypothetical protein HQK81_03685 [Desulfovibrionaceae bacterium]|nr:hypothetical protein [Desulfovibrionaceae bacterium]MBF0513144.1 hypothetical protein [Desulfovibrionaceae bacterium]
MAKRNILRFRIVMVLALFAGLWPAQAAAQDILSDREESSKQYLVQLDGSVGIDNFSNTKAILTLAPSPEGAQNTYVLTVSGWPRDNGLNTFVWVSDDTLMTDVSSMVVCRVVDSAFKQANIHFYYLSPRLLRAATVTQHEKEDIRQARKVALPTRIAANAGELSLNFMGGAVTGRVWITGYDPVGRAFVHYQANIQGELSRGLQSTHSVGKRD